MTHTNAYQHRGHTVAERRILDTLKGSREFVSLAKIMRTTGLTDSNATIQKLKYLVDFGFVEQQEMAMGFRLIPLPSKE